MSAHHPKDTQETPTLEADLPISAMRCSSTRSSRMKCARRGCASRAASIARCIASGAACSTPTLPASCHLQGFCIHMQSALLSTSHQLQITAGENFVAWRDPSFTNLGQLKLCSSVHQGTATTAGAKAWRRYSSHASQPLTLYAAAPWHRPPAGRHASSGRRMPRPGPCGLRVYYRYWVAV